MNTPIRLFTSSSVALALLALAGCGSLESGNYKTRGVYTTVTIADPGLDLANAQYVPELTFAPGENPAAAVVGLGEYNRPQKVRLEVTELPVGRSLLAGDYYATVGSALILPLPIRLGGDYKVRLLVNGDDFDSCQFSVTRANRADPDDHRGQPYAQGIFSVTIKPETGDTRFAAYDDRLIYAALNAVTKEGESTNRTVFAQRFPGEITVLCRLDSRGRLSEAGILQNSFDAACGELVCRALLKRSPYAPWPDDVRQKAGADSRQLTFVVRFD